MYYRELPNGYVIQNSLPEHAEELGELQEIVFPTLSPDERMQARHYRKHIELFPKGQFVVLDGDRIIGMSSTIRHSMPEGDHTFLEISDNLWLTTHEKDGDWLYGMDMGVHQDYRGRGIAKAMYRARQELCRILGLKGQITVGMPNGYLDYADKMSLDEYYAEINKGGIFDPTVSMQQKLGFELVGLIHHYLDDPQCGNGGVMMILPVDKDVN